MTVLEDDLAVYGRQVAAPTVERGVEATVRAWLPDYLGAVLAQAGHERTDLPDPEHLVRVAEFQWPVEHATALVVVATPGTVSDAAREADAYRVRWDVRASVLADLGERLASREAAQFYAAAVGACLTHKGVAAVEKDGDPLGGVQRWKGVQDPDGPDGDLLILEGSSTRFIGETYRAVAGSPTTVLIAGEARIQVTVEGARSAYGGPDAPTVGRLPAEPGVAGPVDPTVGIIRPAYDETLEEAMEP